MIIVLVCVDINDVCVFSNFCLVFRIFSVVCDFVFVFLCIFLKVSFCVLICCLSVIIVVCDML